MPRKSRGTRLAVTFTALAAVVAAPVAALAPAAAAPEPDQLVLTRVGVEGTDYADAPTTVTLVTRGTDGSTTAPDVTLPSSGENPFTLSGSSNAQGALSLSADGRYLSLAGFKIAAGTGEDDPKDLTADEAPRSIARIAADGTTDTSTVLTGVFSGENMRGAASADGSTFYSVGNGKDNASPSGIVLSALGTTAAPGAITTPDPAGGKTIANYRAVSIVDGGLYASGDKPEGHVSRVGTDLPAGGEATLDTLFKLPGTPTSFTLLDTDDVAGPDVAYAIVEEDAIYKFGLADGTWQEEGAIEGTFQAITGRVTGDDVELFVVKGDGEANAVQRIVDSAAPAAELSLTTTDLGTAPAGTAYRGISFAPGAWDPSVPSSPVTDPADDEIVVSRLGGGNAGLTGTSVPATLVSVDGTGASSHADVALPTTGDAAISFSGTADPEGHVARAADGKSLAIGGYGVGPGFEKVNGSDSVEVPRVAASIAADGTVDTTTRFSDVGEGVMRGIATNDGTGFWVAGNEGMGVRYIAHGASTTTKIASIGDKDKVRFLSISEGQLNVTVNEDEAMKPGVYGVGDGLPTTAENNALMPFLIPTLDPAFDPYSVVYLDRTDDVPGVDTVYVSEHPDTLRVDKFALIDGEWEARGEAVGTAYLSLVGTVSGDNARLYGTTTPDEDETGANSVQRFEDTAAWDEDITLTAPTTITTAPLNTVYRGVVLAPEAWDPGEPAPSTLPTIQAPAKGLALAVGDDTNPTLGLTVASTADDAADLEVSATASSNPAVVPLDAITVTGEGAARTATITPSAAGTVGTSNVTFTVTDTTGQTATVTVKVGVSGEPTALHDVRYHTGSSDASTAIAVGNDFAIVADDEGNALRLFDLSRSGAFTKEWDFSNEIGTDDEIDIESAARVGDTIYWLGSHGNNKDSEYKAERSTLFTTTITGEGADTELSYGGVFTGLRHDLVDWATDAAPALAAACTIDGELTNPDEITGCNVEGFEMAPGSTTTGYLGFRAPLVDGKALIVPVTNIDQLPVGPSARAGATATFGEPIWLDLGGRTIRDLRKNADDEYLLTAGVPNDGDESLGWALYRWSGVAGEQPVLLRSLPSKSGAAGQEAGSWETIVEVPADVTENGGTVRLLSDNGTTDFYADGTEGKDLSPDALKKSLSAAFVIGGETPGVLTFDAASVAPGADLTVSGDGFEPGETVALELHSTPVSLGTAVADADGALSVTVTIPADAELGDHVVAASGAASGVQREGAITVALADAGNGSGNGSGDGSGNGADDPGAGNGSDNPGAGGSNGSDGGGLAATGAQVFLALGLAFLALVAGAALVVARRRSLNRI